MQGDVVAIYNESGTKVASYVYDAWGNFTTTYHNGGASLTPVVKNPLLYRGYYYDRDLGMYYLQTRYYDSNIGRFLNADSYVSTGQGILGHNMYAYCNNNPVMYVDPTGELWEAVLFNPYALVAVAAVLVLTALLIDAMTEQAFGKAVTDTVSNIFESDDSNVEADEKTTTIAAPNNGSTYYHITTPENAAAIIASGTMVGSSAEGGYVYAWKSIPDRKAIKESGAHGNVIISFTTTAAFEKDSAFDSNSHAYFYFPVRTVFPGPINVTNVKIIKR